MRSRINFNHLECFLVTARTLSFSRASEELKIAQPAISKQIKNLEEYLRVQLFFRDRNRVLLTQEGKELLERTSGLYDSLCMKVEQLGDAEKITGVIRFGCLGEVGERVFVKRLSAFKKLHQDVDFQIRFLKAFEINEALRAGELDMGIVPQPMVQETFKSYEIFKEEIVLVTNRENANKAFSKLSDLSFVGYRENDPLLLEYLRRVSPRSQKGQLQIPFMVNSHKSIVELLIDHPYYAVLPKLSVQKELDEKKLFQVGRKCIHSSLYLIMRDLSFPDRKLEELRKHLLGHFKKDS